MKKCITFRRIFDAKHKAGEILFQNEGTVNMHECPFPTTTTMTGAKGHVMMASHAERDKERDTLMQPESEPDLDRMVERVQKSI